jgi:ABC-type oligopeptide transport system ATPase subunit
MMKLQRKMNLAYFVYLPQPKLGTLICDRTAVFYLGKVAESCNVDELFENALYPYTQALLESTLYQIQIGK